MTNRDDRELIEWVDRAFGTGEPTPARAARVKSKLLNAVANTPQVRPAGLSRANAGLAAAAASVVIVAAGFMLTSDQAPRAPEANIAATVRPSGPAKFERFENATTRDELVRLHDGQIRVDVVPVEPSRRVIVESDDARIIVRGTAFDVHVIRGKLRSVRVITGRVEVQVRGRAPVILGTGDEFVPAVATARAEPLSEPQPNDLGADEAQPAPTPAPERRRSAAPPRRAVALDAVKPRPTDGSAKPKSAEGSERRPAAGSAEPKPAAESSVPGSGEPPTPSATPPIPRPSELAFQRGWAALRRAEYRAAARAFADADRAGSQVLEEARYWRAIALIRADNRTDAESALRRFLARHSESSRRGEAALLLARLRLLASDMNEAKTWLEEAAKSERADVKRRASTLLGHLKSGADEDIGRR